MTPILKIHKQLTVTLRMDVGAMVMMLEDAARHDAAVTGT